MKPFEFLRFGKPFEFLRFGKKEPTNENIYLAYPERRDDGWPLCPRCGADELWSAMIPADPSRIAGCYGCGWRPPYGAR